MKIQWIQNPLKLQRREYLNGISYKQRKMGVCSTAKFEEAERIWAFKPERPR